MTGRYVKRKSGKKLLPLMVTWLKRRIRGCVSKTYTVKGCVFLKENGLRGGSYLVKLRREYEELPDSSLLKTIIEIHPREGEVYKKPRKRYFVIRVTDVECLKNIDLNELL